MMKIQFCAIGLGVDQSTAFKGLFARQHGTRAAMEAYKGHTIGANHFFYSSDIFDIDALEAADFLDDQLVPRSGAIFAVVER